MNRIVSVILILAVGMFLVVNCGPKKTKEQLYAEAFQLERQEKFKEAIEIYEQLIKDFPKANFADSLLFKVGQMYSNNLMDFEHAVEAHKQLLKKYPNSKFAAQSLFMIGYHYANSISDTAEARKYYQKFLEQYPQHELVSSVKWELEYLGKDINELDFLKGDREATADSNIANPTTTR